MEGIEHEEARQDLLRRVTQGLQQNGDRHLAPPIHAKIDVVLGVELEIQP
jgi:hypothetical protein